MTSPRVCTVRLHLTIDENQNRECHKECATGSTDYVVTSNWSLWVPSHCRRSVTNTIVVFRQLEPVSVPRLCHTGTRGVNDLWPTLELEGRFHSKDIQPYLVEPETSPMRPGSARILPRRCLDHLVHSHDNT